MRVSGAEELRSALTPRVTLERDVMLSCISEARRMTLWLSNLRSKCLGKKRLITGKMKRGKRNVGIVAIQQKGVQKFFLFLLLLLFGIMFRCGVFPGSRSADSSRGQLKEKRK